MLEGADATHALGGVDAGQGAKAVRVFLHRVGDHRIGQMVTTGMAKRTRLGRNQQALLDARGIHACQHGFKRNALHGFLLDPHLVAEEGVAPWRPDRKRLLGPEIDHRVDGGNRRQRHVASQQNHAEVTMPPSPGQTVSALPPRCG